MPHVVLFLSLIHTNAHIHTDSIQNRHTHTHTIDLLLKWWSFRCSRPLQRTFVVRMLISGMPPFAHMHTRVHWVFRTPQSTSEGDDVILSAAAPAEEASKERAREKCKRQGMEKGKKAAGEKSWDIDEERSSGQRIFCDEIVESFDLVILSFIMRSLALSQPEDSCMHIARQCVLILLMLTVELLSRLLSVSVAPKSIWLMSSRRFFCSGQSLSAPYGNNQRHTCILNILESSKMSQRNYHQAFLDWRALHLFTSELVEGCGSPASLSRHATHSLLDASRDTQKHADIKMPSDHKGSKFAETSNILLEAL